MSYESWALSGAEKLGGPGFILGIPRMHGASPLLAFYVAYLVTFNAGAVPGILYSLFKIRQNKSGVYFFTSGAFLWSFAMAAAMALLWYSGLLFYGMASEQLGKIGASVAFALFASGTILFANLFGWLAGEWKGASRQTIQGFVKGMVLIVWGRRRTPDN
jgi:L-rhamnose-H+ transport protein